jgi:broad specificity phosphatase PhoE
MTGTTQIGLIRHFKVVRGPPPRGLSTVADLQAWMSEYDKSHIIPGPVDLGDVAWEHCYASTSPRALETARAIYPGPIITSDLLREPVIQPFKTGGLRLPFVAWRWLLRLAWMTSHPSQRAVKDMFEANIDAVVETLRDRAGQTTLVVSHAGVMMFLRKALLARGFTGPRFGMPECGRLYVFEGRWS